MVSEILTAWRLGLSVDAILRIFDLTPSELAAIIDSQ